MAPAVAVAVAAAAAAVAVAVAVAAAAAVAVVCQNIISPESRCGLTHMTGRVRTVASASQTTWAKDGGVTAVRMNKPRIRPATCYDWLFVARMQEVAIWLAKCVDYKCHELCDCRLISREVAAIFSSSTTMKFPNLFFFLKKKRK